MKKKIGILVVAICLMLINGCSYINSTKYNDTKLEIKPNYNDKSLKITGINVPDFFPKLLNIEQFGEINYDVNNSNDIEIIFNDEIVYKNYTLAYLQYANYYGIKNEYDEAKNIFFKYRIDKNKLIVTPQEGFLEAGIISLYIPKHLESISAKKLGHDKLFIFAANKINEDNLYSFENQEIKRKTKSIMQLKRFNDGKKIAFVNKETKLLNSMTESGSLMLERGETVLILDDTVSPYKVEIKFPKDYTNDMFDEDVSLEKHGNYCTATGYVSKEDLIELSEPLNKDSFYAVKPMFDENDTSVHLIVCESVCEAYELIIWDVAKKVYKEDLYLAEAAAVNRWSSGFIFGRSFNRGYVDEKGNFDYPIDYIDRHMPQYQWSEEDYSTYNKAYDMYCHYLLNILDNYIFPDELSSTKTELKGRIQNVILLEKTWIDWGYKNKLKDKDYFFKTAIEKFSENVKINLNQNSLSFENTDEFENNLNLILNASIYDQDDEGYRKMVKIQKKYMLSLIEGEIEYVDNENSKFDVIDNYDKETYRVLINDFAKSNLKLQKGEKISMLCIYDFDKEIFCINRVN